jgi:hypothetical protein
MAIDRKLDGLTRVHALRMIEDKKIMGKIGLILHMRLSERFDEEPSRNKYGMTN